MLTVVSSKWPMGAEREIFLVRFGVIQCPEYVNILAGARLAAPHNNMAMNANKHLVIHKPCVSIPEQVGTLTHK